MASAMSPKDRFDTLLAAMLAGGPPSSARKKPSGGQASDAADDAYCDDTQTRPDTSQGDEG